MPVVNCPGPDETDYLYYLIVKCEIGVVGEGENSEALCLIRMGGSLIPEGEIVWSMCYSSFISSPKSLMLQSDCFISVTYIDFFMPCCYVWKVINGAFRNEIRVSHWRDYFFLIPCEIWYIGILSRFVSQFLYELTHAVETAPVKGTVETWMSRIGAKLGIVIQYSQRLNHVLVRRANHLRDNMKKVMGGAPQHFFRHLGN